MNYVFLFPNFYLYFNLTFFPHFFTKTFNLLNLCSQNFLFFNYFSLFPLFYLLIFKKKMKLYILFKLEISPQIFLSILSSTLRRWLNDMDLKVCGDDQKGFIKRNQITNRSQNYEKITPESRPLRHWTWL